MTPMKLQESIVEDLAVLFDGQVFENENGEFVPLNIYKQDYPVPERADAPGVAPCVIVYLDSWAEKEPDGHLEATIIFSVTCVDFDTENQGHEKPLHILQRIYERFYEDPYVGDYFSFAGSWEAHLLNPSDQFGFFGGWAQANFNIPPMQRKGGINS